VQVLGRSEIAYLEQLPGEQRREILDRAESVAIACFILTHGAVADPDLVRAAEAHAIPLLVTAQPTSTLVEQLGAFLAEALAPSVTIHGTLLDVYGVGMLILGESGVGKSESALELVLRGHRLVADDTVTIRRVGAVLNAAGAEVSRYHIELRGLGIINIKDLYGIAAVRERKDLDLVVRLDPWQAGKAYDRLGLEEKTHPILGVDLPYLELPVGPGRNLSILLEVAARHHLLKRRGHHPARELDTRLQEALGKKR
jgi:HPr kinase/phosphorylase